MDEQPPLAKARQLLTGLYVDVEALAEDGRVEPHAAADIRAYVIQALAALDVHDAELLTQATRNLAPLLPRTDHSPQRFYRSRDLDAEAETLGRAE